MNSRGVEGTLARRSVRRLSGRCAPNRAALRSPSTRCTLLPPPNPLAARSSASRCQAAPCGARCRVVRVLTPPTPHTRLLGMSQTTKKDMKYVLVTGGVVSGLGKGVTASSVGVLLKKAGQRCTSIKIGA